MERRPFLKEVARLTTLVPTLALTAHLVSTAYAETQFLTGVNMFNGLYTDQFTRELKEAASMRASLVRVMIPNCEVSSEEASQQ